MRSVFTIVLILFCSHAVADSTVSYRCKMNKHVILMDDETTNGKLSMFEFYADGQKLWFDSAAYFADSEFALEALSKNLIRARDGDKIFIYQLGRFHFSFISHSHVTSMSGDCKPVASINRTSSGINPKPPRFLINQI